MISFIPVDKLKPGMVLARDIYGVDNFTSRIVMLRANQKLTLSHITKLISLDLPGVYIHDNENTITPRVVNNEIKQEVLAQVKEIFDISEKASEHLYTGNIEHANDALEKLIDTIVNTEHLYVDLASLRMYDDCTYNHSLGVTVLSIAIGKSLGLSRKYLSELAMCALLHDIGKTKVPIEIIQKPANLSEEEYGVVKEHPGRGFTMLKEKNLVSDLVLEGIASHHERIDGTGYPNKTSGKQIPLFGRIIACADVYDALTAQRPYRGSSKPTEAIEYIMGTSGRQFDRGVVRGFLKCISPYPVGSCVQLSNGDTAVVVEQNSQNPLRPVIFLMENPTVLIDLYTDKNYYSVVISGLAEA